MNKRLLSIIGLPLFLAACTAYGNGGSSSGGIYGSTPSASATPAATAPAASATPAATAPPTTTPAPPVAPASVIARGSALGTILTNKSGRTLYYFLPERGGRIVCASSACTAFWPPSLTSNTNPTAGTGVTGQLSVIMRAGGADQITYSTWPLYTFAGDKAAGQTNGQGVVGFGGKWLAATPGLRP